MTDELLRCAEAALVADHRAKERSVDVVRVVRDGDDVVVAVRFEDASGRRRQAMLGFLETSSGWRGTGGFARPAPSTDEDAAWYSGGWTRSGGQREACGFWVADPAAATLRLTDPVGRQHRATIERGTAVLLWDGDFNVTRARVELLGADGEVLRTGPVSPAPRSDHERQIG
jgi:hypothetical protein